MLLIRHKQQEGAALITALIILLIMVMIGSSGMENTILEEKMVINSHMREIADIAADSATRQAQSVLRERQESPHGDTKKVSQCSTPPLCGESPGDMPIWLDNSLVTSTQSWADKNWAWWQTYGVEYSGSGAQAGRLGKVADQPVSLVEFRSFNTPGTSGIAKNLNPNESTLGRGWHYYNIYGSGVGPDANAFAVIETTMQKWH